MVWFGLSGTIRQGGRGYRVLFVNERKSKEKGEAASVCECEGSKLMKKVIGTLLFFLG